MREPPRNKTHFPFQHAENIHHKLHKEALHNISQNFLILIINLDQI